MKASEAADLMGVEMTSEGLKPKTKIAKVRESGTTFEPEQSNYTHFGEPAKVRASE